MLEDVINHKVSQKREWQMYHVSRFGGNLYPSSTGSRCAQAGPDTHVKLKKLKKKYKLKSIKSIELKRIIEIMQENIEITSHHIGDTNAKTIEVTSARYR